MPIRTDTATGKSEEYHPGAGWVTPGQAAAVAEPAQFSPSDLAACAVDSASWSGGIISVKVYNASNRNFKDISIPVTVIDPSGRATTRTYTFTAAMYMAEHDAKAEVNLMAEAPDLPAGATYSLGAPIAATP